MNTSKNILQINYCNNCPNAFKTLVALSGKEPKYFNWFCGAKPNNKRIDYSVLFGTNIKIPEWCPMNYKTNNNMIGSNENNKKIEIIKPKGLINGKRYEDCTYLEKREAWESLKPFVKWDDIKEKDIYHIPPFLDNKRCDIVVIRKTDYYLDYYEINENNSFISKIPHTVYKSNIIAKMLRPHKLKQIAIIEH